MEHYQLHLGDCLEALRGMPDNSVDSIVTDPPYGLSDHKPADVVACMTAWLAGEPYLTNKRGFMGKTWDSWVPGPEVWRECLRVLKPGGHVLAFAGSRTHDLMSMAMRLAGFECRDTIMYLYGSGFPKSMDVSKAIDRAAGAEREVIGPGNRHNSKRCSVAHGDTKRLAGGVPPITAPATDAARQWSGWGTALKPAFEPVLMFRKPLSEGTVAANVLAHGTGALNIDGCRVGSTVETWPASRSYQRQDPGSDSKGTQATGDAPPGRWPANICHDGSEEVVAGFPQSSSGANPTRRGGMGFHGANGQDTCDAPRGAETGSAARFFKQVSHDEEDLATAQRFMYCAKASKRDRDEGLEGFEVKYTARDNGFSDKLSNSNRPRANIHPTVKPTDLMAYLCRLVTPPGGTVLDPFMGSGSTGKAAMREGFRFIGCELSPEYLAIAEARIAHELAKRQKPEPPPPLQPDMFAA